MFCQQEGLRQIASKFGTSPEELLKEEKTWANGVQQVREKSRVSNIHACCFRVTLEHPLSVHSSLVMCNFVLSGADCPAGRASGYAKQAVLRGERCHPSAMGRNDNLA